MSKNSEPGERDGDQCVARDHEAVGAREPRERRRDEAVLGLDGLAHRDGIERRRHSPIVRAGWDTRVSGSVGRNGQRGLQEGHDLLVEARGRLAVEQVPLAREHHEVPAPC